MGLHKTLWNKSSRYRLVVITFTIDIILAVAKHFLRGIDSSIVATANGLVASFVLGKSWRRGGDND